MQQGYAAVLCECSLGVGGRGWVTSGVTPGGVPGVGRLMPLAFGCPGVLAVLGLEAAAPGECELTRLLQDKLQYEMRLQYMVTPRLEGGREGDVWHCRAQVCSRGTCRLYSERVLGGGGGLFFLPGGATCAQRCPELLLLVHLRGLTTSKGFSAASPVSRRGWQGCPCPLAASPCALLCLSRNTTSPSTTRSRSSTKRC